MVVVGRGVFTRLLKRYPLLHNKSPASRQTQKIGLVFLQVCADGGNNRASGDADGGEAKADDQGGNLGAELDQELGAVLADDGDELLERSGDVGQEVTNVVAGGGNDGTERHAELGETEASDKGSNRGAQLDEELLRVLAGDPEGAADLGGEVLEELAALEGGADGSDDSADGDADGGETKTRDETSNLGGESDQESTDVSADDGDETVDNGAETSDKAAQAGGGGDDATERDTESRETQAGDQGGDLGAQLDEQSANVLAGDDEDVVKLGAEVLHEVAVLVDGHLALALGSGLGEVQDLSDVADGVDNGEVAQLELLGDITELEVLGDTAQTGKAGEVAELGQVGQAGEAGERQRAQAQVVADGSGGDGRRHGGGESDERGLHCEGSRRIGC